MADYDTGWTAQELTCPWCGKDGAVDYEDFDNGNESEVEANCSNCGKLLMAKVEYQFRITKL